MSTSTNRELISTSYEDIPSLEDDDIIAKELVPYVYDLNAKIPTIYISSDSSEQVINNKKKLISSANISTENTRETLY